MSEKSSEQSIAYSQNLIEFFACKGSELYGHSFAVYNVQHMLLYLSKDTFKGLGNCSAFKFENYMQSLRKSGKSPLTEIIKRYSGMKSYGDTDKLPNQYLISKAKPNSTYILQNGPCAEIIQIISGKE